MIAIALDLFQAYTENKIPSAGGYIAAAYDANDFSPAAFEIIALSSIASIHLTVSGLAFQARGTRLAVSPAEPSAGKERTSLPATAIPTGLTFSIRRPAADGFVFLFPKGGSALSTLGTFIEKTMAAESGLSPAAAKQAAEEISIRLHQIPEGNV